MNNNNNNNNEGNNNKAGMALEYRAMKGLFLFIIFLLKSVIFLFELTIETLIGGLAGLIHPISFLQTVYTVITLPLFFWYSFFDCHPDKDNILVVFSSLCIVVLAMYKYHQQRQRRQQPPATAATTTANNRRQQRQRRKKKAQRQRRRQRHR